MFDRGIAPTLSVLVLITLFIIPVVDSQAATTTITAQHDAFVWTGAKNVNYGNANALQVGDVDLTGTKAQSADTAQIYLKFALHSIPDGANITSAYILLRATSLAEIQGPPTVEAHRSPFTGWDEDTITWNTRESYYSAVTDSQSITTGETTYYWDVYNDARSAFSGDKYLSEVMICSQQAYAGFSCIFFSKDQVEPTFAYPPRLQVNYTPPPDNNDDCDDALQWGYFFRGCLSGEITLDDAWSLNNFVSELPNCEFSPTLGKDIVYVLDLNEGDTFHLVYQQVAFDAVCYIATDCDDTANSLACANSTGPGEPEALTFTAPVTDLYFLILDLR